MQDDSYRSILKRCESEIKINKSKFIAIVFPIESKVQFMTLHESVRKKYFDASHVPFAYSFGLGSGKEERYGDDGEPTGSAGKPVLEVINKFSLSNVALFVVRYFGGTKLGVGGLRRAFFLAAEECLSKADIVTKILFEKFEITFDYNFMNKVVKLLEQTGASILENNSGGKIRLVINSRLSQTQKLLHDLTNVTNGSIEINKINYETD